MSQPSEAQIKAGNYTKGHVYAHGMRISIENEADSVRSGVGKDGEPWDSRMQHDYGYIRGTEGADGDHLGVFLGPDFKSREVPVFVIDQHDPDTKKFDEHKVMLGFKTKDAALRAYMGNYPDGHTGARAITPMHIDDFKQWMVSPAAKKSVSKTKRYADGGLVDGGGWSGDPTQLAAPVVEAPSPYTRVEPATPVTQQQMADAWNANKHDPAKVYELMQQNGVGVNEVAKMLGIDNNALAKYINTGRSSGMKQTGYGDDMNFVEQFKYDEVHPEAQTKDEFMATVEPWMLDEQGKFKKPEAGVNYRYEGMTPDEVYLNHQPKTWDPAMERDGYTQPKPETYGDHAESKRSTKSRASWDPINLKWEAGPDNGGGVLGGLARGVGNLATGVFDNPALTAALTAGVGQYMSPAQGAGAAAGGTGTGGSAGIGSGTTLGGGAASSTWAPVQSFMAGPYAQPALNAVKTVASGGSPMDALKSAGTTYFGGQLSNAAVANNPFPTVLSPSAVRYLTNYAVKTIPKKLADGGSTGRAEDQQRYAKEMEHSNTVIKQMLRGWVAGTAGLPGDLEGLTRKVIGWGASEGSPIDAWSKRPPVMPTSEFYKEWLPGATEDPRLQTATDVGSLFGGAGTGAVTKPVVAAGRKAGALTMAAGQAAERGLEPVVNKIMAADGKGAQLLMDLTQGARSNVIKAPGGNWLSGSVEDALKGLKKDDSASQVAMFGALPNEEKLRRINLTRVADGVGELSPEAYAKSWVGRGYHGIDHAGVNALTPQELAATPEARMNNWVDKQLTRYVKNDMATERDPIRALAEQGTLHVSPEQLQFTRQTVHPSGEVLEKRGISDLAKQWENSSDFSLRNENAGTLLADRMVTTGENPHMRQNSWLAKVPPETPVSRVGLGRNFQSDVGFDHLADELRNAMNPESGLPRHLQLKPESLNQVSVPQAVELVSKINKWRAEQKVAANQAIANNPATFTHKEYPDTGFKWVELKAPAMAADDVRAKAGPPFNQQLNESERKALQDALKYEGDTMGHCVGGYCDDVASGNTRILSLRDAKGEPHATVEIRPTAGTVPITDDIRTSYGYLRPHATHFNPQTGEDAFKLIPPGHEILQIKGRGNKGVADKYRPMVQDFLNTFEHSSAQDLNINGLRATKDAWNANELAKIKAMGIEVPKYATQQKIDDIGNIVWPGQWGKAK